MAELKNKFVFQSIISASQVLVPLITYPYITRVLGPENLGKVNYADFVSQVFIILSAFGIPLYAIREIAMVRNDSIKRAKLLKEMTVIFAGLSIVCTTTFLLIMHNKAQQDKMLYSIAAANIFINAVSLDWYIQGMEYFKFAAIRNVIIKVSILACFFLLVKQSNDYALFFGIFTAGMLANAVFNISKVFSENKIASERLDFKKHFTPLFHFFLTSSAIGTYEYFDTIILEHITKSGVQIGLYTTMLKLTRVVTVMIITTGSVMLPRISFLLSEGNKEGVKIYLEKFLGFILFMGIPSCLGLFIFAPEIIQAIAGDKFKDAVPLMQVLCFTPLIIGISNVFCYQVLVSFRQEKKFLLVAAVGCVVSIALNFLLIPVLSAQGAAFATLLTEVAVAVISGAMAYKLIRLHINATAIIQTIALSLSFFLVAIACRSIFQSPLLVMFGGIAGCIIVYWPMQYFVFKNSIAKEMTGYLRNIFSPGKD